MMYDWSYSSSGPSETPFDHITYGIVAEQELAGIPEDANDEETLRHKMALLKMASDGRDMQDAILARHDQGFIHPSDYPKVEAIRNLRQEEADKQTVVGLENGELWIGSQEDMATLAKNRDARAKFRFDPYLSAEERANLIQQTFDSDTAIRRSAMPVPPEIKAASPERTKQNLLQQLPPEDQGKPWQFDQKSGMLQLPRGYKPPEPPMPQSPDGPAEKLDPATEMVKKYPNLTKDTIPVLSDDTEVHFLKAPNDIDQVPPGGWYIPAQGGNPIQKPYAPTSDAELKALPGGVQYVDWQDGTTKQTSIRFGDLKQRAGVNNEPSTLNVNTLRGGAGVRKATWGSEQFANPNYVPQEQTPESRQQQWEDYLAKNTHTLPDGTVVQWVPGTQAGSSTMNGVSWHNTPGELKVIKTPMALEQFRQENANQRFNAKLSEQAKWHDEQGDLARQRIQLVRDRFEAQGGKGLMTEAQWLNARNKTTEQLMMEISAQNLTEEVPGKMWGTNVVPMTPQHQMEKVKELVETSIGKDYADYKRLRQGDGFEQSMQRSEQTKAAQSRLPTASSREEALKLKAQGYKQFIGPDGQPHDL